MKHTLSPAWELTTESKQSHYGIPVLRHRITGTDYGPADLVTIPSHGIVPAAEVVCRLVKHHPAARPAAVRFCRQWPDGPQPE